MENVSDLWFGSNPEAALNRNGSHTKSSKIFGRKLNSVTTLKGNSNVTRPKIIVLEKQTKSELKEAVKRGSTSQSPLRDGKRRQQIHEKPAGSMLSPLNLCGQKAKNKKHKEIDIKTEKFKFAKSKKFTFDNTLQPGSLKPENLCKSIDEKLDSKRNKSKRAEKKRRKTSQLRSSEGISMKTMQFDGFSDEKPTKFEARLSDDEDRNRQEFEATKKPQKFKSAIDLGKNLKFINKKQSEDKSRLRKTINIQNYIKEKKKKTLNEKLAKRVEEETKERYRIQGLEQLEKHRKANKSKKRAKKQQVDKEKSHIAKPLKKKRSKRSHNLKIKHADLIKPSYEHELQMKLSKPTEIQAAITIQRWYRSIFHQKAYSNACRVNLTNNFSENYSESSSITAGIAKDNWVNLLESKFTGSNSLFVEEFKAKFTKNKVRNSDSEDEKEYKEKIMSFSSINESSDDSLALEQASKKNLVKKSTPKVPPLSLDLIKHTEEYSQSESNNWKAQESSENLESASGEDYSMSDSDMNTQWMIELKSGKESKSELKSDKDSSAYLKPGKSKYAENKFEHEEKKNEEADKKRKNEIESVGKSNEDIKVEGIESDYSSSSDLGFEYDEQKGLKTNELQKMQKGLVELLNDNLGRAGLVKKESFTKIKVANNSYSSDEDVDDFEKDSDLIQKSVGKAIKFPLNLNKITGENKKLAGNSVQLHEMVEKFPGNIEKPSKFLEKDPEINLSEIGIIKEAKNFKETNTKHISSSSESPSESEYCESFEGSDSKSIDCSSAKFKQAGNPHKYSGTESEDDCDLNPRSPKKSIQKGSGLSKYDKERMKAFGTKNSDEYDFKKFEKRENLIENVRKVEKILDMPIVSSNNSGKSVETTVKSVEVIRSIEKPKLVIEKQPKGIEIIPSVTHNKLTEAFIQKESLGIIPKIEQKLQVYQKLNQIPENSPKRNLLTETKLITPNDTLEKLFQATEKNIKGFSKLPPLQELPKKNGNSLVCPELPLSFKALDPPDLKSSPSSPIKGKENSIKFFSELSKINIDLPEVPAEELIQCSPTLSLKNSAKGSSGSYEFEKSINLPDIAGSLNNSGVKKSEHTNENIKGTDYPIISLVEPQHTSLDESLENLIKRNNEKPAEKNSPKPNESFIPKPLENLHLETKEKHVDKVVEGTQPRHIEKITQSPIGESIDKLRESSPNILDKDYKEFIEKPAEIQIAKAQVKPIGIPIKQSLEKPSSNLLDRINENKSKAIATPLNPKEPLPNATNLLDRVSKPEESKSLLSPTSKFRAAISESFPKLSPKLSPQLSSGRSPKFFPANLPDFTFERQFKEKETATKPLALSKPMSESSPEPLTNPLPVLKKIQTSSPEQSDRPTRLIEKPSATNITSLGLLPKSLDRLLDPSTSLSITLETTSVSQKPTAKIISPTSEPKSSSEEATELSLKPSLQLNLSSAKANFYAKMQNSMLLSDLSPEDFSLGTPDSAKNDSDSDDSINFISLITRNKDLNKPISLLPDSKPSTAPKPQFTFDIEEAIPRIISDEILNFLRIIPFKTLEKEVDFSLDFIIQYLECLASELKVNEEAVLDAINTPIYSEPLARLAMLQDSSAYLSKFPTLELILPPDLCSELKVHFQSLELPSRQIYLQMLFDCVNEALNYIRPFGVSGMPDPWSNSPRILFGEPELENVFSRIISYLIKWASFKTGCFHSIETQNDDDRLQNLREERMSSLLCVDVRDEENDWLKYDEEETQCKILVAEAVLDVLMDEIGEIFKDL